MFNKLSEQLYNQQHEITAENNIQGLSTSERIALRKEVKKDLEEYNKKKKVTTKEMTKSIYQRNLLNKI